jgi:hypothetical protein
MIRVKVPQVIYENARKLAVSKHEARKNYGDKFTNGDEEANDLRGMVVEYLVCWSMGLPLPELLGTLDDHDFLLKEGNEEKRVDIKASKKHLINKSQFERKPQDLYFFADLENFSFEPWHCELELYGFISHEDVKKRASLIGFNNGSFAYKVRRAWLKEPELNAIKQELVEWPHKSE